MANGHVIIGAPNNGLAPKGQLPEFILNKNDYQIHIEVIEFWEIWIAIKHTFSNKTLVEVVFLK